jgi:hypothetical protein
MEHSDTFTFSQLRKREMPSKDGTTGDWGCPHIISARPMSRNERKVYEKED